MSDDMTSVCTRAPSSRVKVMVITMREVLLRNPEGSKVRLLPKLSLDLDTKDISEKVRRYCN